MTKEEYKVLLRSPKWKKRRREIINRDNGRCIRCGAGRSLQVHHISYRNILPWEYKDEEMITLCYWCHEREHNIPNPQFTSFSTELKMYSDDLNKIAKIKKPKL